MSSEWKKNIEYFAGPFLVPAIMNFIYLFLKIKWVNADIYAKIKQDGKKVIFAFWHGRQYLLIMTHRFRNIGIMTSLSKDGDLQTSVVTKLGYQPVRGSSSKRGAVQATIQLIEKLEAGSDISFAVDGPSGLLHEVKPGVAYIAQKTGAVIIPVSGSAAGKVVFNNWDRYLLPLPVPFNNGVVIYGNPIEVGKEDDLQKKALELKEELLRLDSIADNSVTEK